VRDGGERGPGAGGGGDESSGFGAVGGLIVEEGLKGGFARGGDVVVVLGPGGIGDAVADRGWERAGDVGWGMEWEGESCGCGGGVEE